MPASKLRPILNDLDRLRRHMDLDKGDFGESLMDASAQAIQGEMDRQIDPDGNPWAPLSERYRAWKERYFPGNPMAVLEGIMKTAEQLDGRRFVGPKQATMTYGIDEIAIEHASNFQDPENPDQPERRFYELSNATEQMLDGMATKHFQRRV